MYKVRLYRLYLVQNRIHCSIVFTLVDLSLLSHLQSWLVSESLASSVSAAANCGKAAQVGCFGHLSQTIPVSGLAYHSA